MGFIRVANEAMCRPIRALTQVFWVLKSQLQMCEMCDGHEAFHILFFTSSLNPYLIHHHRLKVMIRLSMCWRVSGAQAVNTPVLSPEPWV